jgi:hypothetical protein
MGHATTRRVQNGLADASTANARVDRDEVL